ncbi:hypothetical protein PVL29_009170 [Vitis rotundifolia]|uniref:Uncharacterized protein n=1 Tax=Vitis rotundifolia TaxID=103349 RepID=A0AA38ZZQ3_VITRO|nr:hypothetical protein PVL29_009170 [Vitis rotundifolia]
MEIGDGNEDDTSLESLSGFSLFEPPVSEPPAQRYIIRVSLDKGKSKMRVIEKLQVKRKQIIIDLVAQPSIYEAPTPTLVTKFAPPQGRTTQFQFMKAPRKKIAFSTWENSLGRKFHEEHYDFKAFVASHLTQFSTELCRRYFLKLFMIPRPFFYPCIIREFY